MAVLLGPEGRRRLALRDKTNSELFQIYDNDLVLRLNNPKNLGDTRTMMAHFQEFLGEYPPSPELAKKFLVQFADRMPRTMYRYAQMIKAFMKWYGDPITDITVKIPKTMPPYTEDADIEKLLNVIGNKRSHKTCIIRDRLMVEVAYKTGMRRAELAALKPQDIHEGFLIVRGGKGIKDRLIPLTPELSQRLHDFTQGKKPDERVFGLTPPSITMKIKKFARKAGLENLHAHTLRHKFATNLLEAGVNIKVVQQLLGHENLTATEAYLSITDERLHEAIIKVDIHKKKGPVTESSGIDTQRQAIVYESAAELTIQPAEFDSLVSPTTGGTVGFFTIELQSDNVLIDSIQVRTSDPTAPYQLMLFESDPLQKPENWENEDSIQMRPVVQSTYTYPSYGPMPYTNRNKQKVLYGGIAVYQRPIRVDLLTKSKREEQIAYTQRLIHYTVSLRYSINLL
ncbi:tyrosine-type recombinase/integrase [Chloroflexota bacterium]